VASKKTVIKLSIIIASVLALVLLVLLLILLCSSQGESSVEQSESDMHEEMVPEKEPEQEETTEKIEEKEPVVDKPEEPAAEQKQKVPQEQIVIFEVDAAKNWQDSGITVTPEMRITIAFEKGKWTIDHITTQYVGAEGYAFLDYKRDYPSIRIGALIGKIGDGKAFKVGEYYEIKETQMNGNLYLRMNDLSAKVHDNKGIITVKILVQQ
jgi:hypothetical protein